MGSSVTQAGRAKGFLACPALPKDVEPSNKAPKCSHRAQRLPCRKHTSLKYVIPEIFATHVWWWEHASRLHLEANARYSWVPKEKEILFSKSVVFSLAHSDGTEETFLSHQSSSLALSWQFTEERDAVTICRTQNVLPQPLLEGHSQVKTSQYFIMNEPSPQIDSFRINRKNGFLKRPSADLQSLRIWYFTWKTELPKCD